ncbi:hypothetical protein BDK51DRAFT_47614 [Blyttiomyces helicus]|uniref:WW domain-containing protein n=1 Tax=Blyttiomyces helicus TaxID=388810 RepID=A0A4P9W4J0_9FUNG|nr:hypothetical protein BDK51DRAFT_47614 [Blyttiomyces helicus]|eukprot:RKO85778.1 hypothetical protein BDK51DRAFT_47614 [Blyttiomyces helicus]
MTALAAESYVPIAINHRIETEEVLGPLPEGWEKANFGDTLNRSYFVDHKSKTTSWIDPRTFHLRKHDIREVVNGELPYGWEESWDASFGVYYMDHLNKMHYEAGPWEESTRDQVMQRAGRIEEETEKLEAQIKEEKEKKRQLEEAEAKVLELEAEKMRLEQEIGLIHDRNESGEIGDGDAQAEAELEEELAIVTGKLELERLEAEQVAQEHARLKADIADFQARLEELKALNERLNHENMHLMEAAQATNQELGEVRNMIEVEAAQRAALEAYIVQLKQEVLAMVNPADAEAARVVDEQAAAEAKEEEALPPPGAIGGGIAEELEVLKSRLEAEMEERERLKALQASLEAEKERAREAEEVAAAKHHHASHERVASEDGDELDSDEDEDDDQVDANYHVPGWVRELNVHAQKSKTLRVKIANKSADAPENLGFREKLLKFTAASIESGEKPKLPEGPANPSSAFAVRARETAFGTTAPEGAETEQTVEAEHVEEAEQAEEGEEAVPVEESEDQNYEAQE